MTQSAENNARAILRVFSSEDVSAGHALMYEAVNLQFLKSCSAEDFAAGLAFARREWLSNENIMIRLTKSCQSFRRRSPLGVGGGKATREPRIRLRSQ